MKITEDNPDMRIVKTATTKTITGKSTLTYQIGCLPDSTIHLRVTKNSGAGMFSDEWVAFAAVQEALKDDTVGAAITSIRLVPLFKGKSVNTPWGHHYIYEAPLGTAWVATDRPASTDVTEGGSRRYC
jgi:hypothetical protein